MLINAIFALLISPHLSANTIVISDIDDTLKIARVRSLESVLYAYKTDHWFKGMPWLFNYIQSQIPEVQFYYVSGAYDWMMYSAHTEFLKNAQLPKGQLLLRSYGEDTLEFKTNVIGQIISAQRPTRVLLFGDNAEADPLVLDKIKKLYPQIQLIPFVRVLYSPNDTGLIAPAPVTPLRPSQHSFMTPLEVIFELTRQNILSPNNNALVRISKLISKTEPRSSLDRPLFFPDWVDCSAMKWSWTADSQSPAVKEAIQKIHKICKLPHYAVDKL